MEKVGVRDAGFAILEDKLSFAVRVRNGTPKPLAGIDVRIALLDQEQKRISSFVDTVPFCPARSSCWWGSIFGGREFGRKWKETESIRARVVATDGRYRPRARVLQFEVARDRRNAVRGRAPASEGMAVVVAFQEGKPKAAIAVNVKRGMGFSQRVRIPQSIFPSSPSEELRAFMYPMRVARG